MKGNLIINLEFYLENLHHIIEYIIGIEEKYKDLFLLFWNRINLYTTNTNIFVPGSNSEILYENDINEYFTALHNIFNKQKKKFDGDIKIFNQTFIKSIITYINITIKNYSEITPTNLYILFFRIIGIPLEYYTLLRIFKLYDKQKKRKPFCDVLNYNKNIILYFGFKHIDIFNIFLSNYFNIKPNISIKTIESCIKFEKVFDFFNY